jgi:hypothetical protein
LLYFAEDQSFFLAIIIRQNAMHAIASSANPMIMICEFEGIEPLKPSTTGAFPIIAQ